MLRLITAPRIRTAALAVAGCAVLCSLAFIAFQHLPSARGGFPTSFFIWDALPYLVAALAGTLAKKRAVAGVCVLASLCVLAVGVYTYIDWIRYPVPGYINDIELFTYPLKWLFALAALFVAVVGFAARKIRHAPANL